MTTHQWDQYVETCMRGWEAYLRDVTAICLDRATSQGLLPLPPLGCGRTEIWYLGDLA